MKNLFSINRAADVLQKDRQTLTRALRHVQPDGTERGQPRYSMPTILAALDAHQGRSNGAGNGDLERQFAELDAEYRRIQNAPALKERRALARGFFSAVAAIETLMHADARRLGEDPRHASLRIAEHTRLSVLTLRDALGWNSDELWSEFLVTTAGQAS
jgi:hypothetical protein